MQAWVWILFALALLVAIALAARRAATVLVIDVDRGRITRARGRAPGEMLRDLGDAVAAGDASGRIELHLGDGGVVVRAHGFDAGAQQRIRNVVGRFPAARLRTAPKVNIVRNTLGMVLAMSVIACSSGSTPTKEKDQPATTTSSRIVAAPATSSSATGGAPAPSTSTTASARAEVPPPNWQPIPEKRAKGFPGVEFAEVRGFAMELQVVGQPVCNLPLDEDGTLCETVEAPGVVLTAAQVKKLLAMLQSPATFGNGAKCYEPHHAFVFYDKAGTPVAEIGICFLCQMATSRPIIGLTEDVKEFSFWTAGISEKGTASLRALCNELGLPKCNATSASEFGPTKSP